MLRFLPLLPPPRSAAYIVVEGPLGVGATTFVSRVPSQLAVMLPEYADASELLGAPVSDSGHPRIARKQAISNWHFACQELQYWHTCSPRAPETAASLLDGGQPIIRDRSFLGSVALSYACASLLGWGDRKDALGSYRDLLSARCIPCPSHLVVLTAPPDDLHRRLEIGPHGHPLWAQPALLSAVSKFLIQLARDVYLERSIVDQSGAFDLVEGLAFIDHATNEGGVGFAGELLERLLAWEPPSLPTPHVEELRALEQAFNKGGVADVARPAYTGRMPTTSFVANPHPWRQRARALWRAAVERAKSVAIEPEMPSHFVDRHAYVLFRHAARGTTPSSEEASACQPPFSALEPAWFEAVRAGRTGSQRLNMGPPPLDAPVDGDTTFRASLLEAWRNHLGAHGVPLPTLAFRARPGETWASLYRCSAHYPMRPPAIRGPSFFDRLSPASADEVLTRFGRENVWRLYAFLLQVHEESHLLQTGEPMLGEVALAHLWCTFLDARDLWCWQRASPTGPSFNIELPWLRQMHLGAADVGLLFRDTRRGVDALFASASAYDVLCEGAWLFDRRVWRYSRYLNFVVWCLAHRSDPKLDVRAISAGWLSFA